MNKGLAAVALVATLASGSARATAPMDGLEGASPARQVTRLGGMNANPDWSADGRWLAFDSDSGPVPGRRSLRILDLQTGDTRQLTSGSRDQAPRWSPDGSRLIFDSFRDGNAEIYMSAADGGSPVRLTSNALYDSGGDWSPDGQSIIWFAGSVPATDEDDYGDSDIWRMNADGSGKVRLTEAPGSDTYPAWSPDGRRVVFTSHRHGNAELYVMQADGRGARRLTNHPASDDHAKWSPDGTRIVFSSWRSGEEQLYVLEVDGASGEPVRLDTGRSQARGADWSPDGGRIAFFGRTGAGSELFVADIVTAADPPASPGDDAIVNFTRSGAEDTQPAWSPDGRFLAFASDRSMDADWAERAIFIQNVEGGAAGRMRRSRGDSRPDWSPDGSRMLVTHADRDDVERILWQRTDGRFTMLPHRELATAGAARWSRDGRWIAFAARRPGDPRVTQIAVSRPDGSDLRWITAGPGRKINPAWSPDGSALAFTSSQDGDDEIYVVGLDGQGLRRLTHAAGVDDAAAWSPDGRSLAFMSNRAGNHDVYVMSARGGEPQNLSGHEAFDGWPAWSPDGARLAFASRRSGNSEIYLMRVPVNSSGSHPGER